MKIFHNIVNFACPKIPFQFLLSVKYSRLGWCLYRIKILKEAKKKKLEKMIKTKTKTLIAFSLRAAWAKLVKCKHRGRKKNMSGSEMRMSSN